MRSSRVATFIFAMTSVLAACTLTVSTNGLTGGPAPATDASAGDAALDSVTVTDAPADAAPDAADATDANLPFCQRATHAYCEDFDGTPFDTNSGVVSTGATLSTTTSDPVSAPRSLSCAVPPSSGGNRSARLRADRPTVTSEVRVEFDAKLCSPSTSGFLEYFKLEFDTTFEPPDPGYGDAAIALYASNGSFGAARFGWAPGGARFEAEDPIAAVTPGVWHHFVVRSKLATSAGTLRVEVDGDAVLDIAGVQTLSEGTQAMRLVLGAYTANSATPCTVKIDNVTVD